MSGLKNRVLVLSILIGGLLRFLMLGHQSFWVDETGTLLNVLYPDVSILHFAFHGNNAPPLYFYILQPFLQWFGESEFAVRFLSALCGTLTLPLFWILARRLTAHNRVADFAVLFLAVNPLHLWFSQEARPYAFFIFLCTAVLLQFTRATAPQAKRIEWFGLTLLLLLTALAHTLCVILVPILLAGFFLHCPTRKKFARLFVVITLFSFVALPVIVYIRSITHVMPVQRGFNGMELPYTFFTFFSGYSWGPPVRVIQTMGASAALLLHGAQVTIVLLVLGLTGLIAIRHFSRKQLPAYVLIIFPVLLATLIALGTPHSYNVRFALLALLGFLLLIAQVLVILPARPRLLFASLLLGLFVWADIQWFTVPAYGKEDSRAAIRTVLEVRPDVRKIAVAPAYVEDTLYYYLMRSDSSATVSSTGDDTFLDSDALLITRRQHVPFAEDLKQKFLAANADRGLSFYRETGYEIIIATTPSGSYTPAVSAVKKRAHFPNDPNQKKDF